MCARPPPTAAAELVAPARAHCLLQLQAWAENRIERLLQQRLQNQQQWLEAGPAPGAARARRCKPSACCASAKASKWRKPFN